MSQMEERGSQDHARLYPRFKVNEKYVEKWQHDAGWGYPRRNEDEKKKETISLRSSGNVEIPIIDREVIGKDGWVFAPHRQHNSVRRHPAPHPQ
jgi:hypothetical protein